MNEILQYARDTRIAFERIAPARLPKAVVTKVGFSGGGLWSRFFGVRVGAPGDDRPIAATQAYVHPDLAAAAARIDIEGTTIFRQLEALAGVRIAQVTKDIQAVPASAEVAAALQVARRSPCLRILRCYLDPRGRTIEVSASHHPGDRFAYSMHIEVDGG